MRRFISQWSGIAGIFSCLAYASDHTPIRAQLAASQQTVMASPMAGRIRKVAVKSGATVKKGTLLAEFDCRALKAEKKVVEARLKAARTQYQVNKELAEYDNISQLEVLLSESKVDEFLAQVKLAELNIRDCRLLAPFSAEVVNIEVNAHEFANVGDPIIELVNLDSLEVEWVMSAELLPMIQVGSAIRFVSDAFDSVVDAKVDRIIDSVDPVSQTVKVIAVPSAELAETAKPGVSGEVSWSSIVAKVSEES